MVNFIIWLTAGAVIGGMTTLIIRRRHSLLLLNIIVGSVGAFVTGYLFLPLLLHISTIRFSLPGLLLSLGGSIVLLAVVNFYVREHTMANIDMEDQWNMVRRKISYRWSKITKDDVEQINGSHDQLLRLIEERYDVTELEAEDQLQRFLRAVLT